MILIPRLKIKDLTLNSELDPELPFFEEFASASGEYFDNDAKRFAAPHSDALDSAKSEQIVGAIEMVLAKLTKKRELQIRVTVNSIER